MTDFITFKNGWTLHSLCKTPKGWNCILEKQVATPCYPHYATRLKQGTGSTQQEAILAATKAGSFDISLQREMKG